MEENLVGYLLDALDPETRREVESYLRSQPDAQRKLDLLRPALEPLAADRDEEVEEEPPADLWVRTLALVAEHQCRPLPQAPAIPASRGVIPIRRWYRRADVIVAACLLVGVFLLVPPSISYARYRHQVIACQDNLRQFHVALRDYSDRHQGNFPNVADQGPRDVAGIFLSVLYEDGALPTGISVWCPASGTRPPAEWSLRDLENMEEDDFYSYVNRALAGGYAYSLGYRDETGVRGLRYDPCQPNNDNLPILADRPPTGITLGNPSNSPCHGGRGQNVLFIGGHCRFCANRAAGVAGDDIYVNNDNEVAAGKSVWDTVLGGSAARP